MKKINKTEVGDGMWKMVCPGTSDSKPDLYLHRYTHMIGFRLANHDNQDMENNEAVAATVQSLNSQMNDMKDHIIAQVDFECWIFWEGSGTQYYLFLKLIMEPLDLEGNLKMDRVYPKVTFDPPTQLVVNAWVLYLQETHD